MFDKIFNEANQHLQETELIDEFKQLAKSMMNYYKELRTAGFNHKDAMSILYKFQEKMINPMN